MEALEQAPQTANLTAAGHELPVDWLGRIALIWSGYAISMFAGNAASYAGIWYATETTGSPLSLALLYVLAFLPMGLLAPFGGVLADKLNRKAIIITCDTFMAACSLALAIWIAIVGPTYEAVALYCAAFGLMSGFRTPAFNATMPLLVPARHLVRINSMDTLVSSVSMIAAPALGILLYTTFGLQAAILLGFFGAASAAITMLLAKLPRDHGSHEEIGPWVSLKEGAVALAEQRGLLVLVVGVSLGMLAYGPIDSLLPLMVYSHFGGDGFAASLLSAVMGVGLLVGSVILMVVNPQNKLTRIIVVAAFVVGAGALVSGMIPEDGYWAFVVCIGILAVACAWFNAPLMTLLQRGIPDDKLGRVMGLFSALNGLAIPAGTALGGVIAEVSGTPLFFAIDGAFMLLLAMSLALSKNVRKLDSIT
jgi:DHA3 family macrolide efflux protein-like MFS transporter